MPYLLFTFRRRKAAASADQYAPSPDTVIKSGVIGETSERRWYHVCSVTDETGNDIPVTEEFLRLFVEDFYSRPEPGPVYLGHADAYLPPGVEEPPARAWVLALDLDEQGRLWALYELTATLLEAIEEGGYRYNSIYGGYEEDDDGQIVAAEFISIAVTNRPAVPGLVPMAASRVPWARGKGLITMTDVELIKAAIKALGDEATVDQLLKWIDAKRILDAVASGEGVPEEAAPAEGGEEVAAAKKDDEDDDAVKAAEPLPSDAIAMQGEDMPAETDVDAAAKEALVGALVELSGGKSVEEIAAVIQQNPDAVAALFAGAPAEGTPAEAEALAATAELELMRSTVEQLSTKVQELEAEKASRVEQAEAAALAARTAEVEAKVEGLVKAGRMKDKDSEHWVKLGVDQPEHFARLVASMGQVVPTEVLVTGKGPTSNKVALDANSDDEQRTKFMQMAKRAKLRDPEAAWEKHLGRSKR